MSVFCEVFTSFFFLFASEEWIMLIVGSLGMRRGMRRRIAGSRWNDLAKTRKAASFLDCCCVVVFSDNTSVCVYVLIGAVVGAGLRHFEVTSDVM